MLQGGTFPSARGHALPDLTTTVRDHGTDSSRLGYGVLRSASIARRARPDAQPHFGVAAAAASQATAAALPTSPRPHAVAGCREVLLIVLHPVPSNAHTGAPGGLRPVLKEVSA
jgi:hypothetical protein